MNCEIAREIVAMVATEYLPAFYKRNWQLDLHVKMEGAHLFWCPKDIQFTKIYVPILAKKIAM